MAGEEIVKVPAGLILELGRIGKWVQAIGLIVVLWIVVQVANLYFNRKRRKLLEKVNEDVRRIERKIDKLVKKIK